MKKDSVSAIYVNHVAELDFILKLDFLLCYTLEQKWVKWVFIKVSVLKKLLSLNSKINWSSKVKIFSLKLYFLDNTI